MKKLIILSDTHGNTKIIDKILNSNQYDIAIHAGDYECDTNYMIKHFDYVVRGNNDFDNTKSELYFEIEGLKFYLQHGHLIGSYSDLDNRIFMEEVIKKLDVDVIIHGHTHVTKIVNLENNKFIINPGSTLIPRGGSEASYLLATVDNDKIDFEVKFVKEIE
ncbi:MAG: metallophosphoesterase family protein [Metamycoplasmataceae bacterium]